MFKKRERSGGQGTFLSPSPARQSRGGGIRREREGGRKREAKEGSEGILARWYTLLCSSRDADGRWGGDIPVFKGLGARKREMGKNEEGEGDADVRVRVRRMKKRKKKAKKTDRRVEGFELVVLSQRGGCSRVARIEGTSRGEKKASARGVVGRVTVVVVDVVVVVVVDGRGQKVRQPKERSGRKKKRGGQKKEKRRGRAGGKGGRARGGCRGGEGGKTLHEGLEM